MIYHIYHLFIAISHIFFSIINNSLIIIMLFLYTLFLTLTLIDKIYEIKQDKN